MLSPDVVAGCVVAGCFVCLIAGCQAGSNARPQALREAVHTLLDGKTAEALTICREILKKDPNHFEARMLEAEIHELLGDRETAKQCYIQAIQLRPGSERAHLCLRQLINTTPTQEEPIEEQVRPTAEESLEVGLSELLTGNLPSNGQEPNRLPIDAGEFQEVEEVEIEPGAARAVRKEIAINFKNDDDHGVDAARRERNLREPNSAPLIGNLSLAIAEGQRLDRLHRERTASHQRGSSDASQAKLNDPSETQSKDEGVAVTRFDLGASIGGRVQVGSVGPSSNWTGHRSRVSDSRSLLNVSAIRAANALPQPRSQRPAVCRR